MAPGKINQAALHGDRYVSSSFLLAVVEYLERAGGPGLVTRALADAGCDQTVEELRATRRCAAEQVVAVARAAARATGDADIGRRTGEEMFRISMADPATRAFLSSTGDPASALEAVLKYTTKLGQGREYRIASRDSAGCVIEGLWERPDRADPFFCGLPLGYWPLLPSIFGATGTAIHPECQCRGDATCRFEIRWDPGAGATDLQLLRANAELRQRIRTFEEMQSVAEDLARAADLPELADAILDAVDAITLAPELVVAISARMGRPPVVASRGLSPDQARSIADDLLRVQKSPDGAAVAPLGPFGFVAAGSPDVRMEADPSSRLMDSFTRHAGARIEAVLSRELAEESSQSASALLGLAASLAQTTTEPEVWECLARAIPKLTGADHSAVLRWNAERCSLTTVAHVGPSEREPFAEFSVTKVPALYEMAARPAPFLLDRQSATGYVADAMAIWDDQVEVIMPLVGQGDFLGLMCAGYVQELVLDKDLAFARMQGAADLAVTACTKARLLEEIRHQALHDDLTGLPNRVLLEDRVRQGLREAKRNQRRLALLFLDLDRFKHINDSMGHKFGDTLIQAAAERIAGTLRESDIFARMGGDEFVIVLHDITGPEDGAHVAEKILGEMRRPFDIGGRTLYISASIGLAVYPDDGGDYGSLLQSADGSMYAAKDGGRNMFSRQEPSAGRGDGRSRLSLETELHRAIETDQLRVVYQPQVAMADLKLVGVEALVRWDHPQMGELPPSEFLPLAEECGLMAQLDRVVRREALRQAKEWHRSIGRLVVSVNLAAQSIRRPELLAEVAADIRESGVDCEAIEVELTEGMVGEDDLKPVVEGLAAMGLRVAIDDFGTGASVFARLQRLPLHTLKIDRSLVQGGQAARDNSILAAIVAMAHSLGLNVVAEGVERPVQAGHLRRAGCDAGQGYLFGRPVAAEEIEKMMYFQLTNLDRPAFVLQPRAGASTLAATPFGDSHQDEMGAPFPQ